MIICGDALTELRKLPDSSVHCCVTSPPYWGLRDYGVAGQLGLEKTPEEYVTKMVEVFREIRRVLRDDGSLWLNLGDSYAAHGAGADGKELAYMGDTILGRVARRAPVGLKPKDLVGIPWRVALALQADGWWLRQDIIWAKPNPMPESVRDRCTKAHEYIFMLSKSAKYYYDADAVKEPGSMTSIARLGRGVSDHHKNIDGAPGQTPHGMNKPRPNKQRGHGRRHDGFNDRWDAMEKADQCSMMVNLRSVWPIATRPFPEAHFATFPPEIPERCIKAGCPPAGKRCDCDEVIETPTGSGPINDPSILTGRAGMNRPRRPDEGTRSITKREQRWHAAQMKKSPFREAMREICGKAFDHYIRTDGSGARPLPETIRLTFMERGWITEAPPCEHPVEPAGIVLDPFFGAGTTGLVAMRLGREFIGIELNSAYCEMAKKRIYGELMEASP